MLEKEEFFFLSSITLNELEEIKTSSFKSEEIKYAVRKATRWLNDNPSKYEIIVYDGCVEKVLSETGLEHSNDNKIISSAKYVANSYDDLVFLSNDILARLTAKEYFGLKVECVEENGEQIYKGYKLIKGNTKFINTEISELSFCKWNVNEYAIIENTDDNSIKEMRFDGEKFVTLKLPPSKFIKGKNSLQRCALDILMNPDITIAAILGGYGSGKTFISM